MSFSVLKATPDFFFLEFRDIGDFFTQVGNVQL